MKTLITILLMVIALQAEAQSSALRMADSLYAIGHYTKAIAVYKQGNLTASSQYKIAKAYQALGNYNLSKTHYLNALKQNPNDIVLNYDYLKLLKQLKALDEALVVNDFLIEKAPDNPNFYFEKGQILERKSNIIQALQSYNKALSLDETHQRTIVKLSKFALLKGAHAKVDSLVKLGLKSAPKNVKLISLKAQNYFYQKQMHEAFEWFNKLIALGESSKFIHEKLSDCYNYKFQYKKAIEQLKLAIQHDKKDVSLLYKLGLLYARDNQFDKAQECLTLYLSQVDEPLDAEYMELGRVYNRQKNYKDAIQAFKVAVQENPENQFAQFYLAVSKAEYYKDTDAKIEAYQKFIKTNPKSNLTIMAKQKIEAIKKEAFRKGE